ncbi:Peptidoglycan hydrolase FlgJ [Massilia sp. Bi118]|uniref:glycoside hydrolase family 73 protein n=1 Tax=Massilia sp. Bi118 TaxID=2822346 RepID=UPI001DA184CC|nr:glucosaminidase domain-containing protein [Massilia sp. Bi118]CAH0270639.1 Peptidoglycan hydrolase FlgJ [Massilia sp. Bi118]
MRHADLNTAFTPATAPTAPTRPTAGIGGGNGFGGVFGSVQEEVTSFIQNGGGDSFSAGSSAALSPEGSMWQARASQAANAILGDGDDNQSLDQQAFLQSIAPWAKEAADKLGVAPELVSAHAALESGWGQRPLKNADGSSTHNLFGIKAGKSWSGDVAESATTEYVGGAALKTSARFRAYPDQASAFRDYAQMLIDNPRFRGALGTGSDAHAFASGLAKGGYATDPAYAAKLSRLAGRLQGISG